MDTNSNTSPDKWTIEDVGHWLKRNHFSSYVELLCVAHKIDGSALLTLTEEDLRTEPLKIQVLGDIKRLTIAITKLQQTNSHLVQELRPSPVATPSRRRTLYVADGVIDCSVDTDYLTTEDENDENTHSSQRSNERSHNGKESKELKPEAWKALVAMLYFFAVTWITAIVMVIVHDRVPDMQTYPPLPDIFLDNVPMIPWAFTICELCGLILFIIWCKILLFHKHRFILLRRMFSLFGSVFLLRCITMIITSLSVPGRHLECKARPFGDWKDKIVQAYVIWQGGGMSIKGVRTCGDYMFSGHTVVLTLLNFFITEYTPPSMYYLHTTSWVLNLFGIFFILAGHEHYSIDVFIAFYISTRLFLYYHTLANNRALYQRDRKRTREWFPLFYFFESGVNGIVPNQFEFSLNLNFIGKRWRGSTSMEKKVS
ncbi:Sphingomyelin synthase-related protein 1 [Halotydeus destructor]|nr:Sphingomyelin synthase-related protein 1 [Halotydeus destructor]